MKPKHSLHCAFAALTIACFAVIAPGGSPASARTKNSDQFDISHYDSSPLLAIVALGEQHVSIYDASGKIMEAPVSSGQSGLETPPGIYSIVQKEEDHHSNIYDDASMPFMERITWTGIALHAGVLPGYPASHGCVRMPEDFAEKLYQITKLGMRVIIVRGDIAPSAISQPFIFNRPAKSYGDISSAPAVERTALDGLLPADYDIQRKLKREAASLSAEAGAAAKREKEAREAAQKATFASNAAAKVVQVAEASLARAEVELSAFERAPPAKPIEDPVKAQAAAAKAEAAKTQAVAKVEAAKAQLAKVKVDANAKKEAAERLQQDAKNARAVLNRAEDATEEADLNLSPVSVFISRKTQRLYVRKNNLPVYEGPVTIRDADKPIGSFVFTALDYNGSQSSLRWNVVSMYKDATHIEPAADAKKAAGQALPAEAAPADVDGARAALKRLDIPEEAIARISQVVLPGASLIISDEGPSTETGKDTDFVVVMSGEPQGGLAIRHHDKNRFGGEGYEQPWGFFRGGPSYSRGGDRGGGGFPFLFQQ